MKERLFICLANSYKRGGRCIAGVEIRFNAFGHWGVIHNDDGTPKWIRPVKRSLYGEVPTEEALAFDLLSIVRVVDAEPCPHCAHSENVYYSRLEHTHLQVQLSDIIAHHLFDYQHEEVFYNQGKAIPPSVYAKGCYSLMFLKPEKALVYVDTDREKPQFRLEFLFKGVRYDLPITDPDFLDFLRDDPEQIGAYSDIFITVPIGLEHEGWHHKLVAGVIGYERCAVPIINIDEPILLKESEGPSYMERQKQLYANAYSKWTDEDDTLLMELYSQGASVTELMEHFGRNRGAIRSRLKKLSEERLQSPITTFEEKERRHFSYDDEEDNIPFLKEEEAEYEVGSKVKKRGWKTLFSFWKRHL